MSDHNAITNWPKNTARYSYGFFIGSMADDGSHNRLASQGWPYSVYKRANAVGVTDAVLCDGIQHLADAVKIRDLLNIDVAV